MRRRWVVSALSMVVACGDGGTTGPSSAEPTAVESAAPAASLAPASASAAKPRRWAALKPDSSAPHPGLAGEVPQLEAEVATATAGLWLPEKEADLRLLLTALSSSMRSGGFSGSLMTTLGEEKHKTIKQAAIKLLLILARQATLPADFSDRLEEYLDKIATQPNHGVWKEGDPLHDFAALAAWFRRDDPEYIREFIRAASKNDQWSLANTRHPMLRSEAGALLWLATQKKATPEEAKRALALLTHKLKEPFNLSGFAVAVMQVNVTQKIGADAPGPNASFVVVRYSLENTGKEPVRNPPVEFMVEDSKDRQFTPSARLRVAQQLEDISTGQRTTVDFQPGVAASAVQVFELPTEAAMGVLEITVSGPGGEFGRVVVGGP